MLLKLINSVVSHTVAVLDWTKVEAVWTGFALSLMGEDLFVSSVFQSTGFLVRVDTFDLHVLLDDVVYVSIQEIRSVLVSVIRKFAMIKF
jgi:hypothetical protein